MRVWVGLYGGIARDGGSGEKFEVEISEGSTAAALAEKLQIPRHLVALVSVNGLKGSWETRLSPGDQVVIFPPITGGAERRDRIMKTTEARVITEIPGSKSKELLALREKYVPRGVSNTAPVFAVRTRGALIEDVDGNTFIDFAGGIGVLNVGAGHPEVVEAAKAQVEAFMHTCFHVVMYEPYVRLAQKLSEMTPGAFPKKTVLVNSGAESVENAIKIARKFTGRPAVVTLENAFHGRTLLAMTLTSKVNPYKYGFGPFAPDVYRIPSAYCYRCPFGLERESCGLRCAENLERIFGLDIAPDQVAAVIAEPVQGEGGFVSPPGDFFRRLQEICRKHGILFIVDEIQTGFGRTGKMFAAEHWGLEPDIITMAKSLGGGLPIAAVTGRVEVMEAVHVGGIGGTYGGNPVAAAVALKVIEVMERDDYPAKGARVGDVVRERFAKMREKYPLIGDVRGLGAMVAMELVKDRASKVPAAEECGLVISECYKKGLILIKAGVYNNVIRFLAPLSITEEQLTEGLDILENSIAEVGRL